MAVNSLQTLQNKCNNSKAIIINNLITKFLKLNAIFFSLCTIKMAKMLINV